MKQSIKIWEISNYISLVVRHPELELIRELNSSINQLAVWTTDSKKYIRIGIKKEEKLNYAIVDDFLTTNLKSYEVITEYQDYNYFISRL
jgi:hypothetical protein